LLLFLYGQFDTRFDLKMLINFVWNVAIRAYLTGATYLIFLM